MKRKHHEPFQHSYVPQNALVVFMLRNYTTFYFLRCQWDECLAIDIHKRRRYYDYKWHELKKSDAYKEAQRLLQTEFHFTKSYVASGDLISRCMRVWKKYVKPKPKQDVI